MSGDRSPGSATVGWSGPTPVALATGTGIPFQLMTPKVDAWGGQYNALTRDALETTVDLINSPCSELAMLSHWLYKPPTQGWNITRIRSINA